MKWRCYATISGFNFRPAGRIRGRALGSWQSFPACIVAIFKMSGDTPLLVSTKGNSEATELTFAVAVQHPPGLIDLASDMV